MEKNNGKEKRARELFAKEVQEEKANKGWKYNRNLLETSIDSFVTIGPDGIITDVNSATEKATGLPREKIIGTDFSEYFTEPDKARVGYKQVFDIGKIVDYELYLKHINGSSIPVLYNASVYKDNEGQIIGALAVARDFSAIKKYEDELIDFKNNLELIVQQKTAELIIANKELVFQNEEKADRAAELVIADKELAFQTGEKADRAAELVIANKDLAFQNEEKAERAAELIIANAYLENLINYANAPIIVLDPQLHITFFNHAFEFITGRSEKEVLGKSLDILFPPEKASKSMKYFENSQKEKRWETLEIEIIHVDGSVRTLLWNTAIIYDSDGITSVSIISQGQDITDWKKAEKEIHYLSYHDQLTGLYNRRFYEAELKRLDTEINLPMTIVMGDVNGLKLINDSFGHVMGDELLKKVAEVIKKGCRADDIIARLGGDEFVILLPKTDAFETEQIIKRINDLSLKEKVGTIDISISFGYETKNNEEEKIQEVFKKAEDYMYEKKLFESPSMRGKTIGAIISTLHEKNKREEQHSHRVSALCKRMGEALGLSEHKIEELKSVGLLHDIGKIAIDENIFNKPGKLTDDEWKEIKRHPEIGYRILSTVNDMSETAEYVLAHHEKWDGKGYPRGLKGEEIPFASRIITIADAYDAMTSERNYRSVLPNEVALEELQKNAGIQFDPKLVSVFIEKVLGNEWGVV